ncbi:hypothetical protein WG66_001307 [Moniliophthora roreri]|nr:hypothetical protein WG66_001307 [Moniliophthora roreri]
MPSFDLLLPRRTFYFIKVQKHNLGARFSPKTSVRRRQWIRTVAWILWILISPKTLLHFRLQALVLPLGFI